MESDNNNDNKYLSSKFLVQYISKEYDKEDERSRSIDSKISVFITISTFFLGYIFSVNSTEVFSKITKNYKLYTTYIILYFLCIMAILASIFTFIWIMFTKKYIRINIDVFSNEDLNAENENKSAYELISGYTEALEQNIKVNDFKIKLYNIGVILLVVSVLLFILLKLFIFLFA